MATSNRDVKLTLGVQTTGSEEIDKLKKSVEELAREGGDAAPEFQQLADEIDRLGQQATALRVFQELSEATDDLRVSQQATEASTAELAEQLVTLAGVTDRTKREQQEAAQNARQASAAYDELRNELQILRNTYDENGNRAANYKAEVERLTRAKIAQKTAVDESREALRQANNAVRDAVAEEARLQAAYNKSDAALVSANNALRDRVAALNTAAQAAEQLGVSTVDVATSQNVLVTAFNRVGAEAAATKAQLDFLRQEQDRYAESQARARRESELAAQAARELRTAFGNIGTQSAQELEAEIRKVRESMDLVRSRAGLTGRELAAAMTAGEGKVRELERSLRAVRNELTLSDKASSLFRNSLGQIAAGNLIADAVGAIVEKVKDLGREFIATVVQLDQFRRGMQAIYKDTLTAERQLQFLRKTANDSGVAFGSLTQAFVRFSAATKTANIPLQVSNDLFASVTKTAGSLGLTTDQTSGALDALAQIASKGVVSLEELRQQLGDRMPGALGAAARGLGITEAELIKLVESGNLAARDFFPAFTRGLRELQGSTDGLLPSFNRLINAFKEFGQSAGDAGVTAVLTRGLQALGVVASAILLPLQVLFETVFGLSRALGVLAAAVVTATNPWEALKEIWTESTGRLDSLNRSLLSAIGLSDQNTEAQKRAAAEAAVAARITTEVKDATDLLALARRLDADATLDQSAKMVQLNLRAVEALKTKQLETEAAERDAKATKEQGESLTALISLRGDEQATLLASQTAAENYAAALATVAKAQAEETAILQFQLDRLNASAAGRQADIEATKVQRQELENKIKTSESEARQSAEAAEAARREVLVREIAAESYRDNSAAVDQYRLALVAAQKELVATIGFQQQGVLTAEQVAAAQERVTRAQALYNDSLTDSVRLQEAYAESRRIVSQEEQAGLQLSLAIAQAAERRAKLDGNEFAARQAQIQQREIELQLYKLKIAAMEAEANGAIEVAKATLAEKVAKGEVTALDQIRIANSIRLAEIKLLEAKALGTNIAEMEKELQALRNGTSARDENNRARERELNQSSSLTNALGRESGARNQNTQAIEAETSARERALAAREQELSLAERELDVRQKERELDSRKRTDGVLAPIDNVPTFSSQGEADAWLENFNKTYRENNNANTNAGMWGTYLYELAMAEFRAEVDNLKVKDRAKELDEQRAAEMEGQNNRNGQRGTTGGGQTAPAGSAKTITINLGGRSRTVNAASQQDADVLEQIFRDLEAAAGRTTV